MFAVYVNTLTAHLVGLPWRWTQCTPCLINVSLGDGVISLFFSHHPSMSTQRNRDFDYANFFNVHKVIHV